jgi:dTDP-4-dehydrorhamnose 3,5-epimerase
MKFEPTPLPGVVVVRPEVFRDPRGFFLETYHAEKYEQGGIRATFVQDNHSHSLKGTLRGLHAQLKHPQGKLVRAVAGEMFDVAVDIRRGSPTFGKWFGTRLSGENFVQLYVPPGFAHGFCVLSERVDVEYKCTDFYRRDDEVSVAWNDPDIGVEWPVETPLLSDKDRHAPRLRDLTDVLPAYQG